MGFASDNKEVILVSLPMSRTNLVTVERDEFVANGETSTHDSTYTGVPPLPWPAVPQVHRADKKAILGLEPADPPTKLFDTSMGMPLFWQERKGYPLWMRLLKDVRGKAVYDLSPGSGQLARACLLLGIPFTGVARTVQHMTWLSSLLDRDALFAVTSSTSPLYSADLACQIREHFKDTADLVEQQDAAADTGLEEES